MSGAGPGAHRAPVEHHAGLEDAVATRADAIGKTSIEHERATLIAENELVEAGQRERRRASVIAKALCHPPVVHGVELAGDALQT